MYPRLHTTMLGRFDLQEEVAGGESTRYRLLPRPPTVKSQSLLAYLLLHRGTPQAREILAEMFWPGRPSSRSRRSLSTALWHIRRCFAPSDPLRSDHRFVQITFPGEVIVDVEVFEKTIKEASRAEDLPRAVALYTGEFLPGLYDDWVIRQRERLHVLYQGALLRLVAAHEARGEDQAALQRALQVLAMDECNEAAHRAAMRAYWRLGQQAAALAQFQRCKDALARELAVDPSAETMALYQKLLARQQARETGATHAVPSITPATLAPALRPPRGEEDAPPLVGRDEEMTALHNRWLEAVSGNGCVVFLPGEAGIGKTRLLSTLGEEVRRGRSVVIGVQCYEHERGQPYGALVEVLRAAVSAGGDGVLQALSSWQIANLARLAPELHSRLPAGAQYMVASAADQKQLLRAMTRLLAALARQSPLLLLLDDLQWAPASMLAWLPTLARETVFAPMMLVGAYRIEEVAPDDLLARIVLRLTQKGLAATLPLERLTSRHLALWLPGLDAVAIRRIHRHTEGNPFFVRETVRALSNQGRLEQVDGVYRVVGDSFAPPLPDSVRQAIAIRLAGLTATSRQGLAVAAVLGRMFDLDVWQRVWGQDEETTLGTLDELLRSRLLYESQEPFGRDYRFEHHLVRETVYQDIPKRRRQQLHIASARALQTLRSGEAGVGPEIAFHYLRANALSQARPWLLQAGDQAVAAAATAEALGFYKRALVGYPRDEAHRFERAVLERKIGDVHFRRGEYEQAEEHLLEALRLSGRPFPRPGAPRHLALTLALLRQAAHRLDPRSRPLRDRSSPALREEVAAYTSLGWMYSLQSRYEEYLLVSLRALNQAEAAGYARGIAVAATALGLAADFLARFGLAAHFHRRARAVVAEVKQPADAGFVAFGQSYHAYLTGDESTMVEQATLAAEKYRQVGDVHRWSLAVTLQAYVLAHRGRLTEVERIGRELARTGRDLQDAEARCAGELLQGLVGRWQGRWEEGAEHHRRAAALAEQIPDFMSYVENLAGLVRCLLRLGRWPEASQALNQASEAMTTHEIKGDVAGKFAVAALEAALWAAEHQPDAHEARPDQVREALAEARKQARSFHPIEPEVWRLCGRYEWLRGHPDAARKCWQKSLVQAEAMDHRLNWGVTALEMGLRLGDDKLQDAGRARLEELGTAGEIGFLVTD